MVLLQLLDNESGRHPEIKAGVWLLKIGTADHWDQAVRSSLFSTGNKLKTINIVKSKCKKFGAFAPDKQVTLSNGKKVRPIALVRPEYWKKQENAAWVAEIEKKPLRGWL
jgi:hypothetical protein